MQQQCCESCECCAAPSGVSSKQTSSLGLSVHCKGDGDAKRLHAKRSLLSEHKLE